MAEVGLLPFARIALQVSKAGLPRYRSRFKQQNKGVKTVPLSPVLGGLGLVGGVALLVSGNRNE